MGLNGGSDARVQRNDIIYFGVCVDNNDPLRAGRIIAVDDVISTADKGQDIDPVGEAKERRQRQIENGDYIAWSNNDPDVTNPYLPPHINNIPQKSEAIKLIYYNPNNQSQNKEYIGPLISRPNMLGLEGYTTARYHTSQSTDEIGHASVSDGVDSRGVFPNPNDIAIQGRHNTDIILGMDERKPSSKEDSSVNLNQYVAPGIENQPEISTNPQILIRAGKFIENPAVPEQPKANNKLTYIQLNQFPQTLEIKEEDGPKDVTLLDEKINVLFEYDIQPTTDPVDFTDTNNPNMGFNLALSILPNTNTQGQSQIYMASKVELKTNFLFSSSILKAHFSLPQTGATYEINKIIQSFDQGGDDLIEVLKPISGTTGTNNPHYGFSPVNKARLEKKITVSGLKNHPIYFRPGPNLVEFLIKNDSTDPVFSTYSFFGNQVAFDSVRDSVKQFTETIFLEGVKTKGYGMAFSSKPDQREIPTEKKETKVKTFKFTPGQSGYVSIGSENIYLLSHNSTELGMIELENNYGMSQSKYVGDIDKKTNSLVRGEKLLDLLSLIVDFTVSHTHAFPGLAPVPTSHGGTTTQEILNKLLKAYDEVLNKNIRIN
tara:strand:- start:2421 stop:4223 length:1803 start_codon:yes stop_codon:yes gene_type:complete